MTKAQINKKYECEHLYISVTMSGAYCNFCGKKLATRKDKIGILLESGKVKTANKKDLKIIRKFLLQIVKKRVEV